MSHEYIESEIQVFCDISNIRIVRIIEIVCKDVQIRRIPHRKSIMTITN